MGRLGQRSKGHDNDQSKQAQAFMSVHIEFCLVYYMFKVVLHPRIVEYISTSH